MDLLQEIRNDFAGIEDGGVIAVNALGTSENIIINRK